MKRLLAILLALIFCSSAAARDDAEELVIVFHPVAECAGKPIVDTTVEAVAASVEPFRGKCVRVRGVWGGMRLYGSLHDYWRTPKMLGSEDDDSPTRAHRLGVYGQQIRWRLPTGMSETEMVGVVGTCEDLAKGAVMVMGYCHYEHGAWIAPVRARSRPLRPVRLTSEADRLALGGLAVAPADMAERPAVVALTRRWLAAVRAGDRKALNALYGQDEPPDPEWDDVAPLFKGSPLLYRDRRLFRPNAQIEIFAGKAPGAAGPDRSKEGWQWGLVSCVCKTADCTGRWPIFGEDAANRIDRPYVCLSVSQMNGPKEPLAYTVDTYTEERGLREPLPPRR